MPFAVAMPLVLADAEAAPSGFGRLEGVVTSPIDGRGLPNVTVVVRSAQGQRSPDPDEPGRLDTTDRDGAFHFEQLPPGLYSLDLIGRSVRDTLEGPTGWVWTQVASVLVVPGVTTTEQVVMPTAPTAPAEPPAKPAPGT